MTKQMIHTRTFRHGRRQLNRQRDALDLLPLRKVLLAAERDARVTPHDSDVQRALQLIERLKKAQVIPNPFAGLVIEPPRPFMRATIREMAESHG